MADEQVAERTPTRTITDPAEESLSLSDHRTYSQQLYGQPAWVLEGVFSHSGLDPNKDHSPSAVKKALENMLGQPDKRYEGKQ